jgi:DNA-binding transcriptional ArsR family regulator
VAKLTAERLDRDQQILSRLSKIEHKVDSIDQTQAFALRAESEKHVATIKKIFGSGKRRAQIYLAADGSRGVEDIAAHLGMKPQNVGPELRVLREEGMLELTDTPGRRDVWTRKQIDRALRINIFLRNEFDLSEDGRDAKATGAKRRRKK